MLPKLKPPDKKPPAKRPLSVAEKLKFPTLKNKKTNLTSAADKVEKKAADAGERNYSRSRKACPSTNEKLLDFDPEKLSNEEKLACLQQLFEAPKARRGLNIQEFRDAMIRTVGCKMDEDEVDLLFMKMDANCDGLVDWEEYVSYNLLEYQGKDLMIKMMRAMPFCSKPKIVNSKHRDSIVAIEFYPNVQKRDGQYYINQTNGRYITLSREGVLSIWTLRMKPIISYNTLSEVGDRATSPWLAGLVCMYNVGMIALSSTDRDITMIDIQSGNFLKRHHLTGLKDCITCMKYWVDPNNFNHARLIWGDTSGSVCMLTFTDCQRDGLFGSYGRTRSNYMKISIPEVIRGFYKGARGCRFNKVHDNWTLSVLYIPGLKFLISCSQTTENALCINKLQKNSVNVSFKITKGVLCFDYCLKTNIIVTGCMNGWVRAWNPYVTDRSIYILRDHVRPITHVKVNTPRKQIISIDKSRTINIYDMKEQTLLQSISGRLVKLGNFPISSIYFNRATQHLVMATNRIAILRRIDEDDEIEIKSHLKPVVFALYNRTFKFIVSACKNSVISVWDLNTGTKVIQTINAHVREERGIEVPVEITAMAFDEAHRSLITAGRDGSIKEWNFHNGSCMNTFQNPEKLEISGIVCAQHRIFTTGWSRKVHIYISGGKEEQRKDWKQKHSEDILCIAYLKPKIIATGSYDGDVIIWSRDTGQLYCTLNASKGTKPIGDVKAQKLEKDSSVATLATDSSSDVLSFESLALEQAKKAKANQHRNIGKSGIRQMNDFESIKETPWNRQQKSLKFPIEHPLLPLYHEQSNLIGANRAEAEDFESKRQEYDKICQNYESAVERILFLTTRDRECMDTAILLTCGAEGWVRAWSINHEGGLLGQFNAGHKIGESVHTMSTDRENKFLITADSLGYVKVWDISEYCKKKPLSKSQRLKRWNYLNKTFPYVRFTYRYEDMPEKFVTTKKRPPKIETRPPPSITLPEKTLKWPFLANSFRAHTKTINYTEYVDENQLIVTASRDCSIRVWTLYGIYIGTFGETWEYVPKLLQMMEIEESVQIPPDLRKVASSSSLKVLNKGRSRLWQIAIDGAKKILKTEAEDLERAKLEKEEERTESTESEWSEPVSEVVKPQIDISQSTALQKFKKTFDLSCGSEILGKSYKKTMGHREPPVMDKFIEVNSHLAIYRCLNCYDVEVKDEEHKRILNDVKNQYFGGSLLMKMKGESRRPKKKTGFALLYKNITDKQKKTKETTQEANRIKKAKEKMLAIQERNMSFLKKK